MCWAACRDETTSLVTSSLRRPLLKPLPLPATMCVVLRIWLHLLHASNLFVFAVADSQSHATLRLQVAAEIITSPRPQLAGCCFWWSLFVTVSVKPNAQQKTRVELMAIINRWRLTFLVQFELYTVSKNAPTLASCSFDNHGLIWYFFLVNGISTLLEWYACSTFLIPSLFLLNFYLPVLPKIYLNFIFTDKSHCRRQVTLPTSSLHCS